MSRQSRVGWQWFVFLVCLGWAGFSSTVGAEAAKRVAVLEFKGPSAAPARKDVVKTLSAQSDIKVLSAKQVDGAARKLGASLKTDAGMLRVAEQLQISAFVQGEIDKGGKKGLRVQLTVINGRDGAELGQRTWVRKKPQVRHIGAPSLSFLADAIAKSEAPHRKAGAAAVPVAEVEDVSGPDTEDEEDADEDEAPRAAPTREKPVSERKPSRFEPLTEESAAAEDEPERDTTPKDASRSARHPALVVNAGVGTMWRTLSYDGSTTLAIYENSAGSPAVNAALAAQWFPGAHFRSSYISNIGLEGEINYALGLKSKQADRSVSTKAYDLGVNAVLRIPFAYAEPRLRVGYMKQVFDADLPNSVQLPGVSYSAIRFGGGVALFLGDVVTLDANFAYLYGLGTGELESSAFAPGVSVYALEVGAGLMVAIKEVYGLRLSADYRRWGTDFSSATSRTSTLPDHGADGYLRTTLAFVYRMPGMTKPKR